MRLVLLDIKMPSRDGKDVLSEIRRLTPMQHVPVIVFSSSDAPNDVRDEVIKAITGAPPPPKP